MIAQYSGISPKGDLLLLRKLGDRLGKKSFLHINSTKAGGGVAEILHRMIPKLKARRFWNSCRIYHGIRERLPSVF